MIQLKNLSKSFGNLRAVDGISFEVPKGQVLGFLGPNGAGKSTTMKMLTCFIEPSGGTATVGGKDIVEDSIAVRKQIGYLPESAPSYGEMTVCEFLTFVAELRGMRGQEVRQATQKMAATCFLEKVWHQPIETLSKGYRQRVGFAQALIHDPPVLILDEPTDGLDPNQKHEVRELIRNMGQDKTIILSTHILEEVESVCQRAIIIASGQIVADASPDQLLKKSRYHNAVTLRVEKGVIPDARSALENLQEVARVELIEDAVDQIRIFPNQGQTIVHRVSTLAREKSWTVTEMHVEQGRLDEVFRQVTLPKERTSTPSHKGA